jgi:LysR family malonate utilization transcriptional regulator
MEGGNLTRAAELLDVSTVSVHRALHSLEEGVRCALFRHEGGNLVPTDAAQVLADVARDVLKLMSDGVTATRSVGGYSANIIKIASLYSVTIKTVPTIIIGMKLRKPALQTELTLGSNADLLQRIKQRAADAALMAIPQDEPDIESSPLFQDDIVFTAPAGSMYADPGVRRPECLRRGKICQPDGRLRYLWRVCRGLPCRRFHPQCRDGAGRHLLADEPRQRRHRLHTAAGARA